MSAFTDHVRACPLCREEKECAENVRLIGEMEGGSLITIMSPRPTKQQLAYQKKKKAMAMAAGAGK